MNQSLIEKVRKGEAAIEHTMEYSDLPLLDKLLKYIFPEDDFPTSHIIHRYYFKEFNSDITWWYSISHPPGMEAIALKDFLEDEVYDDILNQYHPPIYHPDNVKFNEGEVTEKRIDYKKLEEWVRILASLDFNAAMPELDDMREYLLSLKNSKQ